MPTFAPGAPCDSSGDPNGASTVGHDAAHRNPTVSAPDTSLRLVGGLEFRVALVLRCLVAVPEAGPCCVGGGDDGEAGGDEEGRCHAVDVGVAGGCDEGLSIGSELCGGAECAADAFFDAGGGLGWVGVGEVGDVGAELGAEDRADEGEAHRGADFSDGVVECG